MVRKRSAPDDSTAPPAARRRTRAGRGRHALWLIPAGAARRRLAGVILRLAREHGGPRFAPHVTLLAGIEGTPMEIRARLGRFAAATPRLDVRLTGTGFSDTPFRCIHLRVERSAGLVTMRRRAIGLFAPGWPDPGARRRPGGAPRRRGRFTPHLSLFYGRLPNAVKRRIAAALGGLLRLRLTAGDLHLVRVSGIPESWRIVGRARLRRGPIPGRAGRAGRRTL